MTLSFQVLSSKFSISRGADAHLSGRHTGRVAQRAWWRGADAARARAAEEGELLLLHNVARRDGHRRDAVAGALLRDHDRQFWIGRDSGEQFECLFDALPPIHCVKVAVVWLRPEWHRPARATCQAPSCPEQTPHSVDHDPRARVEHVDAKSNQVTVTTDDERTVSYDPRRLQGVTLYRETERAFATGDRVQSTAPDRIRDVANRELGTIERIDANGRMEVRWDSGRTSSL